MALRFHSLKELDCESRSESDWNEILKNMEITLNVGHAS